MARTLIHGATCVLPTETTRTSVLVEGEKILGIGVPEGCRVDRVIDATGLHLLPGVIDDQVHFRDPGLTAKEDLGTGSMACAKGGVTTFLEMPNTIPSTISCERLAQKLEMASKKSLVNYGFYIGATPDNVAELKKAKRTPGIKIFIGSSTGSLLVDNQDSLERIFAETSLPITAHCEDEATVRANIEAIGVPKDVSDHSRIRNHEAAIIATQRTIDLAKRHRHRFHVLHVSTAGEVELFHDHQNLITAEACPHHLFFNTRDYPRLGSRIQMNPSIKTEEDQKALWQGLHDGRIQVIATDHAPHLLEEKEAPYPKSPSGLPAVENSLALMLNEVHRGTCTLEQVVHWMCEAPSRVWDICSKGKIEEGYDADLVLVDLQKVDTIRDADQATKCKWSPWDGVSLQGWPVRTWVMGEELFCEGKWDLDGRGQEAVFDPTRGGYWSAE